MNRRAHWFWHCLLSGAAIAFFGFFLAAVEQRDEARRQAKPVIEINDNTMVIACPKPIIPTASAGSSVSKPRFVL